MTAAAGRAEMENSVGPKANVRNIFHLVSAEYANESRAWANRLFTMRAQPRLIPSLAKRWFLGKIRPLLRRRRRAQGRGNEHVGRYGTGTRRLRFELRQ